MQCLGVRSDEWQPDLAASSEMSNTEPSLGFFVASSEGSVRNKEEREVRRS